MKSDMNHIVNVVSISQITHTHTQGYNFHVKAMQCFCRLMINFFFRKAEIILVELQNIGHFSFTHSL